MTEDQVQRRISDPTYRPSIGERSLKHWRRVIRIAFVEGDTTTVRAVMCAASLLKGIAFLLPGTMERPYFAAMGFIPSWVWMLFFLAHTVGVLWRFSDEPNNVAGFFVNGYGVLIWFVSLVLGMLAIKSFSPENGMEFVVLYFAVIALYRTGDRNDRLSS